MINLLFVCSINICRSKSAEAILKNILKNQGIERRIHVESAGIYASNGALPDMTTSKEALKQNYVLEGRSQKFIESYFLAYPYIFAATKGLLEDLKLMAPNPKFYNNLYLMTAFSKQYKDQEIPDPFGQKDGFQKMFKVIEDACLGIAQHIQNSL